MTPSFLLHVLCDIPASAEHQPSVEYLAGEPQCDAPCSMPSGQQFAYFAAIFGAGMLALAMAVFVFLPVIIIAPAK